MAEADDRFTDIFHAMTDRQSTLLAFRDVSREGVVHARPAVHKKWAAFANDLFTNPRNDKLFIDKEQARKVEGGAAGLGKTMAETQLAKHRASVDAASLVFAHSVLDGIVMDYCRLTAFVALDRWTGYVGDRRVSVADVDGKTYAELAKAKVEDLLNELARESLIKKCDRMFEVCRPDKGFVGLSDYRYDRERLKTLDSMRHDIIHGSAGLQTVRNIDDEIWFLIQTCSYFMSMVNYVFDLRIDPNRR